MGKLGVPGGSLFPVREYKKGYAKEGNQVARHDNSQLNEQKSSIGSVWCYVQEKADNGWDHLRIELVSYFLNGQNGVNVGKLLAFRDLIEL